MKVPQSAIVDSLAKGRTFNLNKRCLLQFRSQRICTAFLPASLPNDSEE
jgi:hypothetical protein